VPCLSGLIGSLSPVSQRPSVTPPIWYDMLSAPLPCPLQATTHPGANAMLLHSVVHSFTWQDRLAEVYWKDLWWGAMLVYLVYYCS
jgi:hypothetical protein